MARTTDTASFEEVYKTAYSHGLENIYALENVDIKTVRPLQTQPNKSSPVAKRPVSLSESSKECCFNFGPAYRGAIEPFVLKEPVQVLGLTRYIESVLAAQGKKVLRDLLNIEGIGFGQGHLEEIRLKLHDYLDGRHLEKARRIDFKAWLKATAADVDRKKLFVALEAYGLGSLFPLSVAENMELRRLTLEKRAEWREEAEKALLSEPKRLRVDAEFREVAEVFVRPWMDCRYGLATELEVVERLQNLSEDGDSIAPILEFFKHTYFKGVFPMVRYLEPLEADLFASSPCAAEEYDRVIERALSYFYSPQITYPFDALAAFLEREFSRSWIGFREGFLAKALKLSPCFFVHKSAGGILHIRLA